MSRCGHNFPSSAGEHADADQTSAPRSDAREDKLVMRASAAPFGIAPADETQRRTRIERLKSLLDQRIVVLDGAMGTMIQRLDLDEAGFRGERFRDYGRDLKGNNDLLVLTRPEAA